MPKRHGNSKFDTVVERVEGMDDPFIQRYKLREGWKVVRQNLLDNKHIRFIIDETQYNVFKVIDYIQLINKKTGNKKVFHYLDIEDLCRVIITSDKWEVLF